MPNCYKSDNNNLTLSLWFIIWIFRTNLMSLINNGIRDIQFTLKIFFFTYLSTSLVSSDLTGTPFILKQSHLPYCFNFCLPFCIWRFACFRLITCSRSKHLSASSFDILSLWFSIRSRIIFGKLSNTAEQMSLAIFEKELCDFQTSHPYIFYVFNFLFHSC